MRALLLTILLCCAGAAFSQDPVISLNIVTKDDDTGKKLPGAKIVVKSGGSVYVTKTSASNGKVPPIDLPLGQNYTIYIQKEGYVTKVATVDGHYDYPEDLPPFIPFPIQTSLFKEVDGVDFNWLETTPMIKFELDQYGNQTWDQKYTKEMLDKIADLKEEMANKKKEEEEKRERFDELVEQGDAAVGKKSFETAVSKYEEALTIFPDDADVKKKLEDAKKALEDANKAEETEKAYKDKMEAAKNAYDSKEYESALNLYKEASSIKPDESEPKTKIAEIEKLLADQKANKEKFDKLVADGDAAVGKEEYDNAISKYEEALNIFDDPDVKTKLENAKKAKADKEAADAAEKEKEEKYNNLITEADKLFDAGSYEDAKKKYEEALTVKPGESHPSAQISKIDDLLKQQAEEAEKEQKYKELITAADNSFDSKDWEGAISKYEEALKIKPDEKHPKDRIEEAKKNKENEAAEAELNEKYDKLMTDGKGLMNGENYEDAITKFKEASDLKKDEQEPKDLIAECEKKMQEKADAEATEAEYKKLMEEGNQAQSNNELEAALGKYEGALKVKPGDSEAQKKIDEVKQLMADKEAAEEQDAKFKELVDLGDKAFDSEKYEDAKSKYEEALKIKDDQGVKDKISKIDELLKQQAEDAANQENYDKAIKDGNAAFDSGEWAKAIEKYEEALTYKDDQYPKDRINEARNKMAEEADQAEKDKMFNDLVAEGDQFASNEKYMDAIKKYEEAIAVKPDPEVSKKIQDMKDKQKEAEENAQADAEYTAAIEKADGLRDGESYEEAIKAYEDALKIKPNESYPTEQINKCKEILKQKEQEEADKEAFEKKYNDLITSADKAFDSEDWESALKDYEEALTMKPNESHPKERSEECKKNIADRDAAKNLEEKYTAAIERADKLFDAENYKEAKDAYQEALNLKPAEKYPDDQMKLCDEKIQELADNEAEQEYQKVLSDAKTRFDNENYEGALELYEKAKGMRPSDPFPQEQIDKINQILKDLEDQKGIQEKYQAAIDKADDLFNAENYKDAKAAYEDALDIKSDEQYPKDRIELCNTKMQEQSDSEEEEQYQKILKVAQEKMDAEEYDRALELFKRAKDMKPSDPVPQKKIDEIEQILKDLEDQKALDDRYNAAIDKADGLFDAENYKDAKAAYEEALALKSQEKYPQDQITLCNEKMQEQSLSEEEEQYQKILKVAQEKMDAEEYERALELYKRAKDMKPSDPLPQKKIDEIEQILKDLADQKNIDDAYKLALEKADGLFDEGNYKDAKPAYEAALDIKSEEQYPKDQIELCNLKMQEESLDEEEEQYQRLLKAAQKKFDEENWEKALEYYERAKGIRPQDPLPQQRIDEINQILKELDDEALKRKKFNELVSDADNLFEKSNWKDARTKYEEALDLYDEKYPRDQVNRCIENLKNQDDAGDAYRKLIAKADEYFDAENWDKAKNLYKRATGLNPRDQYPKDQLKRIEDILNPPKEKINGSPELTDYGNPVNRTEIELERMLQEANEEAEYYEIQQVYQAREDADEKLREWENANEDNVHGMKEKTEDMNDEIIEMKFSGEEGRKEARDQVTEWREEIGEQNAEYTEDQNNIVYYQDRVLENIEDDIEESNFENSKPREEYEADVEKLKLEKEELLKNEDATQTKNTNDAKDEIDDMVETHIVNDPNNDVDRLNTIVEIEDRTIILINKNNSDSWNQEDKNYMTKDEQEYMVDEIIANNLESDNKRAEFEEVVDEQKISVQERERGDLNDQLDKNYDVKKETETIREDLEEDAFIANEKRQGYEEVVEEKVEGFDELERKNTNYQQDKNYDVKEETENIREDLEEDALIANEKRQGYEEVVEEKVEGFEEVETENTNYQLDRNYNAKDETEKIREDLEEDALIANEKRQGYEEVVEEKTVLLHDVEVDNTNYQVDRNYYAKGETEKIEEDLEEDALEANEKRQGYEEVVEDKIVIFNEVQHDNGTDQIDRNHDTKNETEKIREDLEEDALDANEKRQGYEEDLEVTKDDLEQKTSDLTNDQNDVINSNDEDIEKIEDKIDENNQDMYNDQVKNADKNMDAIEEHIEHINDKSEQNEQALIDGENYVEELKDLNPYKITPEIANELGKKFPEGVTETSFVLNDSRGLMKAYVIRRIVVYDGVGTVYEKTQARHGTTSYTRNGTPITEYQWDDETGGGTRN